MKYIALLSLLFVASCVSPRLPQISVRPMPALPAGTVDSVRYGEVIRSYSVGRFVDPNHPQLMHEQHPVYRVEASGRWNLHPGSAGFANPLSPPADAAFVPPPAHDVVLAELSRQQEATGRVMQQAAQLARSYDELQKVIKDMGEVARNHLWMRDQLAGAQQRLAEMERALRGLAPPSFTTNEPPVTTIQSPKP